MLAIKGVYENGAVILQKKVLVKRRHAVVVTFLEEIDENDLEQEQSPAVSFSFAKSRELLKGSSCSLAEAVIEERRREL